MAEDKSAEPVMTRDRFVTVLKPLTVSAIAMAYRKVLHALGKDAAELSLDTLMTLTEKKVKTTGKNETIGEDKYMTLFAHLVAIQIKLAEYDNPKRYLTKDHYQNARREEMVALRRFQQQKRRKTKVAVDEMMMGSDRLF